MIDFQRLAQWMDDNGLPGAGEPIEERLLSGGTQHEIYEIDAVPSAASSGSPRSVRRRTGTRASCVSGESSRRLTVSKSPTPHRACKDASVLGRPFYLMGFVADGLRPVI